MSESELERAFLFEAKAIGLPAPETEYPFAKDIGRKWRFDFAWPHSKVALEIEGGTFVQGRHSRGKGMEKDIEKMNMAGLLGWLVVRATGDMVKDGRARDVVLAALTTRGGI